MLFSFYSCELELEHANPLDDLMITTGTVQEVSTFSCKVQGTITTNKFNGVDNYGHCWSLQNNPTINNGSTSFGKFKGKKLFVSDINNLAVNTSYYVRAYAKVNDTILYGENIKIETIWAGDVPLIQTGNAGSITSSGANILGIIVEQGQSSVIRYGHCWSNSTEPIISDNNLEVSGGSTIDTFSTILTNLSQDVRYYYRAYAVNDQGLAYGPEKSFSTTDGRPSVSTIEVSEIKSSSAISEGEITGSGDASITKHGHCWSTSTLPTVNDPKTEKPGGSSGMIFSSNLTNLSPVTDYYVRSYAENSLGTAYGNEISFSTNNGLAVVKTGSYDINGSLVSLHGQIIEIGDGIIEYGHYWSTSPGITTSNYEGIYDLGPTNNTGNFTTPDISLNPNTTYYYMAYAKNTAGIITTGTEEILPVGIPWVNMGVLNGVYNDNDAFHIISSNNIWAVGTSVWNWDGNTWNTIPSPCDELYAVHGTSSNNIWVIGNDGSSSSSNLEIWGWNGSNWTQIQSPSYIEPDILVFNGKIFVGGIANWDFGVHWTADNGTTWYFTNYNCNSGATPSWIDMDGTDENNIWIATTSNGTIVYNGVSWNSIGSGGSGYDAKISVLNTTTAYQSYINNWSPGVNIYYNGSWDNLNVSIYPYSYIPPIDALSITEVWMGADKIYKHNGSEWIEETGVIGDGISILKMVNNNEGWAITRNGTVLKRQ